MGFLKLLHRGTGHSPPNEGSEAAETSKKREKQDEGGTKTSVASNKKATAGSAAARSNAVQDAPPRIDWELRRRPSTQLITLDLGVDATDAPWVDVARETDASPSSGSLGFSAALHAGSSSEMTVNPKLAQILDGYKLDVEQCTVLISACTRVIAEQGLDTLGIFRPWRAAESRYQICKALGLFIRLSNPEGPEIPLEGIDFLGLKQRPAKEDKLAPFQELLQDLGIHNVVACLKWGLRHVDYGPKPFGWQSDDAWSWYRQFSEEEKSQVYPPFAFTSILLPKLAEEHVRLLEAVLSLIALVAAHASQNAMTASHLCSLLGFWLFGRQHIAYENWEDLVREHEVASLALHHIFLAYLRMQKGLAFRLQELIETYPKDLPIASTRGTPNGQTLHVIIAFDNGSSRPIGRRQKNRSPILPGNLLLLANKSVPTEPIEEWHTWANVRGSLIDQVGLAKYAKVPDRIIAEETARVFNLIAERAMLSAKEKKVVLPGAYNGKAETRSPSSPTNRRRSASLDRGLIGRRSSPTGSVGDGAATDLSLARGKSADDPEITARLSWGDFSNNGFSEGVDKELLSMLTDFSAAKAESDEAGSGKPNKLKKPYPFRYRFGGGMTSPALEDADIEQIQDENAASESQPVRLVKVTSAKPLDPTFTEVYLDALQEPIIRASWPLFVVAELKPSAYVQFGTLLVEQETHVATSQAITASGAAASAPVSPTESKQARPASLATTAGGDAGKRNKSFLGSMRSRSKRRATEMFTRVGNSASMTSLSLARKGSRSSAVIPSDAEASAQEVIDEGAGAGAVDEMGRLSPVSADPTKAAGKKAMSGAPRTASGGVPTDGTSTPPVGLYVDVPATSATHKANELPKPIERPPLPVIMKTSPSTPPRYFLPSPQKAAPDASMESSVGGDQGDVARPEAPQRKLSRKPVPAEEEGQDVFSGIQHADAEPTSVVDQDIAAEQPHASLDSVADPPGEARTTEEAGLQPHQEKADALSLRGDDAPRLMAADEEDEEAGTALTRKLRAEIAARAAKTQEYFAQSGSPELPGIGASPVIGPGAETQTSVQSTVNPVLADQAEALHAPAREEVLLAHDHAGVVTIKEDVVNTPNVGRDDILAPSEIIAAANLDKAGAQPAEEEHMTSNVGDMQTQAAAPSAVCVPDASQAEVVQPKTVEAPVITSTEALPPEEQIIDALAEQGRDDTASAVFPPDAEQKSQPTKRFTEEPHADNDEVEALQPTNSTDAIDTSHTPSAIEGDTSRNTADSAGTVKDSLERVRSRTPSMREQLDEDIRRAAAARKRPSIESQSLPTSPEVSAASLPTAAPASTSETPSKQAAVSDRHPGTATPTLALSNVQRRKESLSQASQASPSSPAAERRRFGETFNRVSPSLKARLAGPFSRSSEKLDAGSPVSLRSEGGPTSPLETVQTGMSPVPGAVETADSPTKAKKTNAPGSPSSPSKAGKLISGAKKILGRKKSSSKAGEGKDKEAVESPPMPTMSVWPDLSSAHGSGEQQPTDAAAVAGPVRTSQEQLNITQPVLHPTEADDNPPTGGLSHALPSVTPANSENVPAALTAEATMVPAEPVNLVMTSSPSSDKEQQAAPAQSITESLPRPSEAIADLGARSQDSPAAYQEQEPDEKAQDEEAEQIEEQSVRDAVAKVAHESRIEVPITQTSNDLDESLSHRGTSSTAPAQETNDTTHANPAGGVLMAAQEGRRAEAEVATLAEQHEALPESSIVSDATERIKLKARDVTDADADAQMMIEKEQHTLPGGMLPIETPLSEVITPFAERPEH